MKHRKKPSPLQLAVVLVHKIKSNHLFAPTVSLLLITLVVSVLLSGANSLTAPRIEMLRTEESNQALRMVAPAAKEFSELEYQTEDDQVSGLLGAYSDDTLVGYCVEVSPIGFGGVINMIVGVDLNGSVTGVHILDYSETPGLGTQANTPDFLNQYIGKSGTLKLNAGANSIEAITGATVTSTAITRGVNAALGLISSLG